MSRKRKHAATTQDKHSIQQHEEKQINPALFIQAYEADIIQGPQSKVYAESLEFRKDLQSGTVQHVGSSLLKWNCSEKTRAFFAEDEPEKPNSDHEVWVDRYDARLLLDSLPDISASSRSASPLSSDAGWSDLPSDTEDTFHLSKEDAEDYRRQKRRKIFEQNREERLKALQDTTEDDDKDTTQSQAADPDAWGGSDEEPDEQVKEIMRRTAKNLQSASNPTQLEMRILANFGADKRFAFLRGRWSKSWASIKVELNSRDAKAKKPALGALADYSDSDNDSI